MIPEQRIPSAGSTLLLEPQPDDAAQQEMDVPAPPDGERHQPGYMDGPILTEGAVADEKSSPETAAGASAPLSEPALESAPRGEDGPLVSEADPTSNAG